MHPVVLRGVEDVLQGAETVDALRVDPELEERVELDVHDGLRRRDGQGQGEVERLKGINSRVFFRKGMQNCPRIRVLTMAPKNWKADCLREVVRLYSSEL